MTFCNERWARLMARGGEFAEVFVEDRTTSSAMLDQRRVEQLSSGRDRGAGIRVVVGDTTGFAHTADLSEDGLVAAARAAAAVARGAAAACARSRSAHCTTTRATRRSSPATSTRRARSNS